MKTKILLSILMLVISMMVYTKEKESIIPLEKMKYTMNHPRQEVVIDSAWSREYSPTMLYIREITEKKIILYKDGKIIGPYTKITKSPEQPAYHLILWIVVGVVCSFFWGYKRYIICELISLLICFNVIQPNVYWWIPVLIVLTFGLVIVLGSLCRIKKLKL